MKPSLIGLLRSPVDGSRLRLEEVRQEGEEVVSGRLVDAAGIEFPVVRGVPRFAASEGRDETFSFKWKQIGDYGHEEKTRNSRRQWYLDRFGFETPEQLVRFLEDRPMILDAGTGTGVDAAMFAESGSTVVAFDLSATAVEAAYRHVGRLPNVHVVQADVHRPPFPQAFFNFVSCDQVLHHTPDTSVAFSALARHVKPAGRLAVYVYRRKGPIREFADDYLRTRTTRMTPEECFEFCKSLTLLGKALSNLRATIVVPDIPLLGITSGTEDVQRFVYWNVLKCFWNEEFDFTTNAVVNFDWYHPQYANRHTGDEMRAWFAREGFVLDRLDEGPSGISGLGTLVSGT